MPITQARNIRDEVFDLVLVGTGFASSFFLHRYLERIGPRARILVLERGPLREHAWQVANDSVLKSDAASSFTNHNPTKPWGFRMAFGGGSNCWWACTPRFRPDDFKLRSLYGVGRDWPLTYDDLERYYCEAEEIMEISGPADGAPFPRSRPYPQPPHRFSDPDKLLKRRFPDEFFNQPTARPSRPATPGRPRCCASGVCGLCPIDSKFTILNTLRHRYDNDPLGSLVVGTRALDMDIPDNRIHGVRFFTILTVRVFVADLMACAAGD
jgi:choline dehydrogenase-like flavoprotein